MQPNTILLLSYWYPNKINQNFGIFVKRHAQAIKQNQQVIVMAVNIIAGKSLFKKSVTVFEDENKVITHQLIIESKVYKLLYLLLPWQYVILKNYIQKHIITKFNVSILHSNVIFPCAIVGYKLGLKFKWKHVITEHWTRVDKFFSKSLYKNKGKRVLDKAHAITVVSDTLKNTIEKYSTNKKFYIIPNVIDNNVFFYDNTIPKNEELTFIAAASWMPHKNPFYFLEALNELHQEKKLPPFNVVMIGVGEQLNLVKAKNYQFEIDFKGQLSPNEIKKELNKSHIFLHGSDYETFSVIIAEALFCGLPSVVSPYGIANQVINKTNGFVTNNTHNDWKEKIVLCYNSNYDNEYISNQIKDKYSVNAVAQLFSEVYRSVMEIS